MLIHAEADVRVQGTVIAPAILCLYVLADILTRWRVRGNEILYVNRSPLRPSPVTGQRYDSVRVVRVNKKRRDVVDATIILQLYTDADPLSCGVPLLFLTVCHSILLTRRAHVRPAKGVWHEITRQAARDREQLRACADRLATFHIYRFSARSNRLLTTY